MHLVCGLETTFDSETNMEESAFWGPKGHHKDLSLTIEAQPQAAKRVHWAPLLTTNQAV